MSIFSHETKRSPRGHKPDTGETSLRCALRFSSQELRRDLVWNASRQGGSMNAPINEAITGVDRLGGAGREDGLKEGGNMQRAEGRSEARFVVRVEDRCTPGLSGGYEGCELEVEVPSLADARALGAALLEGNDAELLKEGEAYMRARAGGRRTVTLKSVAG